MPRYFFHVMDGRAIIDKEGTELPGPSEMRRHALETAGQIVSNQDSGLSQGWPWQMTVVDESDKTVYALWFEAREYEE